MDVSPRPSDDHIIRPITPTQPLGPHNFQWVLKTDLARPTTSKFLLSDGRYVDIHEAMRVTGLKRKTIYERARTGVPLEDKPRGLYLHEGVYKTAEQLALINNVPLKRLKKRIARGMPIERAILVSP